MPLAPKARAGRRWRHGYYTVLARAVTAERRLGGRRRAPEGRCGGGAERRRHTAAGPGEEGSKLRRRRGVEPWAGGGEVSTLRSGHPCRRRRVEFSLLSLPSRTAGPAVLRRCGSHTSDAPATRCDVVPFRC